MSEYPTEYSPGADVPIVDPIDPESIADSRVRAVAVSAQALSTVIEANLPDGPSRQLALRYASLVVQAAHEAVRGAPPLPSGSTENESAGSSPAPPA